MKWNELKSIQNMNAEDRAKVVTECESLIGTALKLYPTKKTANEIRLAKSVKLINDLPSTLEHINILRTRIEQVTQAIEAGNTALISAYSYTLQSAELVKVDLTGDYFYDISARAADRPNRYTKIDRDGYRRVIEEETIATDKTRAINEIIYNHYEGKINFITVEPYNNEDPATTLQRLTEMKAQMVLNYEVTEYLKNVNRLENRLNENREKVKILQQLSDALKDSTNNFAIVATRSALNAMFGEGMTEAPKIRALLRPYNYLLDFHMLERLTIALKLKMYITNCKHAYDLYNSDTSCMSKYSDRAQMLEILGFHTAVLIQEDDEKSKCIGRINLAFDVRMYGSTDTKTVISRDYSDTYLSRVFLLLGIADEKENDYILVKNPDELNEYLSEEGTQIYMDNFADLSIINGQLVFYTSSQTRKSSSHNWEEIRKHPDMLCDIRKGFREHGSSVDSTEVVHEYLIRIQETNEEQKVQEAITTYTEMLTTYKANAKFVSEHEKTLRLLDCLNKAVYEVTEKRNKLDPRRRFAGEYNIFTDANWQRITDTFQIFVND